jgi:ribosomal subunit interface protein
MDQALQITFRNMEPSPAVEATIREKVAKLEQFYSHIVSCRVVVELDHRHHHKGNHYRVAVHMKVPEGELVANRTPDQHHSHTDAFVAVRDAFDAIKKQLDGYASKRRGDVKLHEAPPVGRVLRLDRAAGFGFIGTSDGREIYFHRNSVVNVNFDSIDEGAEVRFAEEMGDEGPQASSVQLVGRQNEVA